MSMSSLSSVVSNLVRASMGSSVSNDVADEDLDRHVAELILKEAKQKGERYTTDGIQAYLKNGVSDSNAPKANKRFLSSIIRNTDDHNRTILRAQAFAAQEIKRAREEQERKERKARAEEAVAAERTRRLLGTAQRGGSDRWSRTKDMERAKKRKERAWERPEEEEAYVREKRKSDNRRRRHRHRSLSEERDYERRRSRRAHHDSSSASTSTVHKRSKLRSESGTTDDGDAGDDNRRHRCGRHGSRDRHRSSHKRRRHRSRSVSLGQRSRSRSAERTSNAQTTRRKSLSETLPDNDEDILDNRLGSKSRHHRSSSPLHGDGNRDTDSSRKLKDTHQKDEETHGHCFQSRSRTPTPVPQSRCRIPHRLSPKGHSHSSRSLSSMSRSPSPPPNPPPSKMDKYFEESYDPRLDIAPLSSAPKVPAMGLIDNSEFEGWDAMLELIRIRRVDKEEQKTLERLGLGKGKKDKKDKDKKWKGLEVETVKDRWREGSQSIMEIEYKKRGSVREWDLGKAEL